jgi:DUF4097 and DUF4098 domain-containing protein YvlB
MPENPKIARRLGVILGAVSAVLVSVALGHASDYGALTEEFHKTYPLAANGRVALENINGAVHISAWDRNEVKVDAVKRAGSKERLDEAQIKIDAGSDSISIRTEYPDHDLTFRHHDDYDNPASVEYTLTVPRQANLDKIELVNGSLDVQGISGEVRADCVNGRISAKGLQGRAKLSTVNSRVDAEFEKLGGAPVDLSSVNGGIVLTLPSDASADLEASTVSGRISNEFGLGVNNHRYVGHDLRGQLGSGGTRIRLENVNGRIEIRRANDNRALSPVKDMNRLSRDSDGDDDEI